MSARTLNPLTTDLEPLRTEDEWQAAALVASRLFDARELERSEFGWLSVRTPSGWNTWIGMFDGQTAIVRRLANGKKEMMIL